MSDADRPQDLVPEGFDLEAARSARSTTPREQFRECPECGSVTVHAKGFRTDVRRHAGDYYCKQCGAHFDEPAEPADPGGPA